MSIRAALVCASLFVALLVDAIPRIAHAGCGFYTAPVQATASAAALPAPVVASVDGGRYLTISFRRPALAAGLTYTVFTADSPAGPWVANAVQVGTAVANGDGTETVVFRDAVPSNEPGRVRRFMKVEVTRAP